MDSRFMEREFGHFVLQQFGVSFAVPILSSCQYNRCVALVVHVCYKWCKREIKLDLISQV